MAATIGGKAPGVVGGCTYGRASRTPRSTRWAAAGSSSEVCRPKAAENEDHLPSLPSCEAVNMRSRSLHRMNVLPAGATAEWAVEYVQKYLRAGLKARVWLDERETLHCAVEVKSKERTFRRLKMDTVESDVKASVLPSVTVKAVSHVAKQQSQLCESYDELSQHLSELMKKGKLPDSHFDFYPVLANMIVCWAMLTDAAFIIKTPGPVLWAPRDRTSRTVGFVMTYPMPMYSFYKRRAKDDAIDVLLMRHLYVRLQLSDIIEGVSDGPEAVIIHRSRTGGAGSSASGKFTAGCATFLVDQAGARQYKNDPPRHGAPLISIVRKGTEALGVSLWIKGNDCNSIIMVVTSGHYKRHGFNSVIGVRDCHELHQGPAFESKHPGMFRCHSYSRTVKVLHQLAKKVGLPRELGHSFIPDLAMAFVFIAGYATLLNVSPTYHACWVPRQQRKDGGFRMDEPMAIPEWCGRRRSSRGYLEMRSGDNTTVRLGRMTAHGTFECCDPKERHGALQCGWTGGPRIILTCSRR